MLNTNQVRALQGLGVIPGGFLRSMEIDPRSFLIGGLASALAGYQLGKAVRGAGIVWGGARRRASEGVAKVKSALAVGGKG